MQRASAALQRGDLAEAERLGRLMLAAKPDYFDALHLTGLIATRTGRAEEAVGLLSKAASGIPGNADLHYNLGVALHELRRHAEAVASYQRAIAIRPAFAEALNNCGNALRELGRYADAVASYDRAIAIRPDLAGAHNNRGIALRDLKRYREALESYDRALALEPNYGDAYNNRGIALRDLKRHAEALASYERAFALKADDAELLFNRGNVLLELGRNAEAVESYDRALALEPRYADACNNRGVALDRLKRHAEALASYRRAAEISPDLAFVYGSWLHTKMQLCDWDGIAGDFADLRERIERHEPAASPFFVLAAPASAALQRAAAEIWVQAHHPANRASAPTFRRRRREVMRIGYFSADFHAHPTSYLTAGLFEHHDRSRVHLTAFSYGPHTNDPVRQRLCAAFDRFLDVRNRSDDEVVSLARDLEIDIAVDLKGFTQNARTGIFAARSAPIQVSYLGYPGTMGAEYIDYLVADNVLVPLSQQAHYSEKIAYLPHSYQVNDPKRPISSRSFTREELGLPRSGFVFCSFNNSYKILPDTFDCWMRLLIAVPGSVLWLLEDTAAAAANLRKEAARRGVDAGRLVFAPRMPLPEHLARHRLADLFVDTLPYNAHTTASDALWAGLPVLTCLGTTFAGRVAASLLDAVGLPELVTGTTEAYERLALSLAGDPDRLASIREKLARNRLTAPLFDARLFAKHLEAAYAAMYDRCQAGLPPEHIHIAA